ncbi:Similar to pol: Retrovirus-related Pol polyprotein from type-2 retrotransposable element R2DM (Drosophila melanogaster) [Cotesia congregata]|uniref:Similar to pol: Retrovirus-related Pol polyprotein from type-2 retrotransposable element R2DM (Drosophila melanogaster) n=1 Tax=Cotesia congregata TaxID=51543 RepID=A0A8J2HB97_COTCN|nr:Similar to pol: Retrovirus-related Pol polyprotein from type-2 retrotransposable element R2DM (Drosophila melanogaster) [Cotesia congregata]
MDHLNHRGIALVEDNKIVPEAQSGFRPNRGCLDNLFVLTTVLNCRLRQKKSCVISLRAFDSVNHKLLWQKLFEVGRSTKIVRLLRNIYNSATLKLRINRLLSKDFKINEGVLQEELLSPLLFIIFIADLEPFMRNNECEGVNIDGYTDVLLLLYADDLVIMASSEADLQKKTNSSRYIVHGTICKLT